MSPSATNSEDETPRAPGMLEAIALSLVPAPFREFLPYVSPSALRVIHRDGVLQLALAAARDSLSESSYRSAVASTREALAGSESTTRIRVVDSIDPDARLDLVPSEERSRVGERILEVYFRSIFSEFPLALDFRPDHFGWDSASGTLYWRPSRLRASLSPEFRGKIAELYAGFFEDAVDKTAKGLSLYAWKTPVAPEYLRQVESLMRDHFGDARSTAVRFEIGHFQRTFHLVFELAIRNRAKLHPELTLIGTALAGLYVTLERIGAPLDVHRAYRSVCRK